VFFLELLWVGLPPAIQYQCLSNDNFPEDKTENYWNCSMLYCVRQLCTMIHTCEQLTFGLGFGFL